VQDVPVSVTAYNSDTLDALNVTTLESLSYSSPNVSLDDVGTSKGTANFAIRGLGVNSSIPSIDPAVGVFVDGVYLGINSGVVVDLFDIDSIEILRGPQGLLFGRNTTGGAVVVNTGNPTDDFHYKVRASVDGPVDSDRGGANSTIQGVISGPLVEGKLNGKFGIAYNTDDGYFKNL
jgi:iron complex outermembrane receptor protein